MRLQHHKKVSAAFFALIACYLVYGMFAYYFRAAPFWQQSLHFIAIGLYSAAAYGLIKESAWSIKAALPCAALPIIAFPVGTALAAYFLWVLFRSHTAVRRPQWMGDQEPQNLSLPDFAMYAFLIVLIPYAAFAGNTIGGLNFIAAVLAVVLSGIGLVWKIARKSKIAWLYVGTIIFGISLFFIRSYDAGYGP